MSDDQEYTVIADNGGGRRVAGTWQRDDDGLGVINAMDQAARLSLMGEPHEVLRPDGRLLARFVGGAREGRTRPLRAPVKAAD